MAFYPYAPEFGGKFTLLAADGSRATFNDSADADYVGILTDATGLDSADVRDGGDVLVAADGGYAGNFYYGRRPMTFPGTVFGHTSVQTRNVKMSKLMLATNCMVTDGQITHVPSWRSTNLIPNPNLEYGTAGWTAAGTASTFAQSSTWSAQGTNSLHVIGSTSAVLWASTVPLSVVPNTAYTVGATLNAITGTNNNILVNWSDASGTFISQSSVAFPASLGVHAASGTVTSPANAAFGQVYVGNSTAATCAFYIDKVWFSRESAVYSDGDMAGNYWHGTIGNSASGNYIPIWTTYRRQLPLRFTGGYDKGFQALLVSQFAPLFSAAQVTTGTASTVTAENCGNYPAYPIITLTTGGAGVPIVTNTTTGTFVRLLGGYTPSHVLSIDTLNHTMWDSTSGTDATQYLDLVTSTWPALVKGMNTLTVGFATSISLTYRHAWN